MEHFVRTVYGDSKTGYGGAEWEKTPHGCGTGNGQGPSLWAGISSPLLTIMKSKGFGTKMESPILHEAFDIAALTFVDDTDRNVKGARRLEYPIWTNPEEFRYVGKPHKDNRRGPRTVKE